jgi:hypothetical protein
MRTLMLRQQWSLRQCCQAEIIPHKAKFISKTCSMRPTLARH